MPSNPHARRISIARSINGWTQAEFGELFNVGQKQVSVWERETSNVHAPKEVRDFSEDILPVGKFPNKDLPKKSTGEFNQFLSEFEKDGRNFWVKSLSEMPGLFLKEFAASEKRIDQLTLEAVVSKSKTKGFADVTMMIKIEGAICPKNEHIFLDLLGLAPPFKIEKGSRLVADISCGSEIEKQKSETTDGWQLDDSGFIAFKSNWATVRNVERVQTHIGPHAIAYTVHDVVADDDVTIKFKVKRGVAMNTKESAGLPIYPDVPVKKLKISVVFEGLSPTSTPKFGTHLIRRTNTVARPEDTGDDLLVFEKQPGKNCYETQTLLYPKSHAGYGIAWTSLKLP